MAAALAMVERMSSPVGTRLRAAREARGWNQNELASAAHVGRQWINQVESGEIPNPGLRNLSAVAAALGVTVDYLRYGTVEAGGIPIIVRPEDVADVQRFLERPRSLRERLNKIGDDIADLFIEHVPNHESAEPPAEDGPDQG